MDTILSKYYHKLWNYGPYIRKTSQKKFVAARNEIYPFNLVREQKSLATLDFDFYSHQGRM